MTGALESSLNIAKQNPQNFKVLHPVLQVLRIYTNSSVNCTLMVKHGTIETMLKILPSCGQKRTSSGKLVIEILVALAKSKLGAKKAVLHGAVPLLLNMFMDLHRSDHRHRQIALRKSILTLLKLVVVIYSGRKAFINIDGPRALYNIGSEALECKELDGIVKLIVLILRRCFTIRGLPIQTSSNTNFPISSAESNSDIQNSEDEEADATNSEDDVVVGNDFDDMDSPSGHEENKDVDNEHKLQEEDLDTDTLNRSSNEDLQRYKIFVTELSEYKVDNPTSLSVDQQEQQNYPIKIPTASMELPEETCSYDENESNMKGIENNCFPFIKRSSSFDYNSLHCNKRTDVMMKSLSTDAGNALDITTVHPIAKFKSHIASYNQRQNKIASMPCFPVIKTADNNEPVEFLVQGVRVQKREDQLTSSPDVTAAMRKSTDTDDQILEMVLRDENEQCKLSTTSNMLTVNDKEHSSFSLVDLDDFKETSSFVKRPSPDVYGHYPMMEPEPLLEKKPGLYKQMIFQDFSRFLNPDKIINRVVYDLDDLVLHHTSDESLKESSVNESMLPSRKSKFLQNKCTGSSTNISEEILKAPTLHFESRFESGNLRKAIQIRQYEYDLILNPDTNADRHCQWFYFEVSNMESNIAYKFNIINCEKFNSQFNFGMQPVMYSTKDAKNGHPGWERNGSNICYYKNCYQRRPHCVSANRYHYTTTFTIKFPHQNDVCYLAYHYPFTYTMLKGHLSKMESRMAQNVYYQRQKLCDTPQGNRCDVLTITERPDENDLQSVVAFRKRPYIILTSRVHPGETCASWVMKGVVDFLTSNNEDAKKLREVYIFKIIPFLNPDGVIHGNHRCSTFGEDLNRRWISPDSLRHPTIYHTKRLIQYLNTINKSPLVFCDFHGHSRKKNVFMYGCSVPATIAARLQGNSDTLKFIPSTAVEEEVLDLQDSTVLLDSSFEEDTNCKTLPRILNAVAAAFSIQSCSFIMEKSKEATARIVVFKDLGVTRSYTVESTYCGADQGPYKGNHFGTRELEEMGKSFCLGLLKLSLSYSIKLHAEYFNEPSLHDDQCFTPVHTVISLSTIQGGNDVPSV